MHSPWGPVQIKTTICRGFVYVSTAGHGGFMLSKTFAEKHLRKAALRRAERYGGYYCYEHDADWAIPAWELPNLHQQIFSNSVKAQENPRQYILERLSSWNADYLLEIGVTPDPERYANYLAREQ